MNILVTFKVCPNLDLLQAEDLAVREGMGVDTHFLPNVLNCYDESSLELALRLRDQAVAAGQTVTLSALTVGGESTEDYLKTLKALGFQHTVRVHAEDAALRFRPETVARTVAAYALETEQNVILMGTEAPLGNHGAAAQVTSVLTGYPLLSSVTDVAIGEDGTVVVCAKEGERTLRQTVQPPCVLAVGNAVVSKLRVPTLRARMQCKSLPCETFRLELGETVLCSTPHRLEIPDRSRQGYVSARRGADAVEDVYDYALRERLEAL